MLRALVLDDQGVLSYAEPGTVEVLARARAAGVRCGVLSDTEATTCPYEVDATVLSGEAGVREPYLLAAQRLGVAPGECVFVDDVAGNVRAAVGAGMVGVHHVGVARTVEELEALLGVPLRP